MIVRRGITSSIAPMETFEACREPWSNHLIGGYLWNRAESLARVNGVGRSLSSWLASPVFKEAHTGAVWI